MGQSETTQKTIKVSEEVHDELSTRKHGGEPFNDVLKRELGLVPRTADDLARALPDQLSTAVVELVDDHVNNQDRYKLIGRRGENVLGLKFVSRKTNRSIYEIVAHLPTGGGRSTHRVDIKYRNPQNELQRIAKLSNSDDDTVKITDLVYFDTHETSSNSRTGEEAGHRAANDVIGPEVAPFVEQAYEQWGV